MTTLRAISRNGVLPPARLWTDYPVCPYCTRAFDVFPRNHREFEYKKETKPNAVTCQSCSSRFYLDCVYLNSYFYSLASPLWTSVGIEQAPVPPIDKRLQNVGTGTSSAKDA